LNKPSLASFPELFKNCSQIELQFLSQHLKPSLHLADDVVVRQGDEGHDIYFIVKGRLEVWVERNQSNAEWVKQNTIQSKS